jgi:transmembrane sensor
MSTEIARSAASKWLARQASDDYSAIEREQFNAWLSSHPENAAAWQETQTTWRVLESLRDSPEIVALRQQAKRQRVFGGLLQSPWTLGMAATLILTIGIVFLSPLRVSWLGTDQLAQTSTPSNVVLADLPRFETKVGERTTHSLADGSQLLLNTDSAVRVSDWTETNRTLILERGEAYFTVAKDSARPFVVKVADASITAVGTEFSIRRDDHRTMVSLVEGRVRLASSNGEHTDMTAGFQGVINGPTDWVIRKADVSTATSWRSGRLIFDNEPLASVITEINRYSTTQLTLSDQKLGSQLLSGVFRTGDANGTARTLQSFGIVRIESADERVILLAKPR